MPNPNLYQLAEHWLRIQDAIVEADGELTPAIQEELDAWEGQLEHKVDAICSIVRNAESRAAVERSHGDQFKSEADRYYLRAKVQENTVARLKKYLLHHLQAVGVPKVEADKFTARIQRNSTPTTNAAELDPERLPERFVRVCKEVDARAIIAAWKDKDTLPEGVHVEIGNHLRIQ